MQSCPSRARRELVLLLFAGASLLSLFASSARADLRVLEENGPRTHADPEPTAPRTRTERTETRTERRCVACEGAVCESVAPTCGEGQVASVVGGCWGACVAADRCGVCEDVTITETTVIEAPEAASTPPPTATTPEPRGDHRWLDITAFLQPGFIVRADGNERVSRPPQDDAFWLQRARFGVRAQLFWWLRARLELELTPVTLLQDAFVELPLHAALNLRVGQFIVPFLRAFSFNELNLGFLDRPLYTPLGQERTVIRYLAPRDIGGMISGFVGDTAPESTSPVFEYQLAAFVGRGPNVIVNDDGIFLWALRLTLHVLGVPPGNGVESDLRRSSVPRVAVSLAGYSNCDDRGNWNRGFTFDLEGRWEGLYASAAFVWLRNGRADPSGLGFLAGTDITNGSVSPVCGGAIRVPAPTPEDPTAERNVDFVSRGAHFQVQYALPRFDVDVIRDMDFELLARVDWVDALAPYSESDPLFGTGPEASVLQPSDYVDSDNGYERWRLTFGLNWFPTGLQSVRVGLNYQLQYETESVVATTGSYRAIVNDVFWLQLTAGL